MRAAVVRPVRFDAVADDDALAMRTSRRDSVNRAFEAVERVRLATYRDGERLVVVVPAVLAFRHAVLLPGCCCDKARRGALSPHAARTGVHDRQGAPRPLSVRVRLCRERRTDARMRVRNKRAGRPVRERGWRRRAMPMRAPTARVRSAADGESRR